MCVCVRERERDDITYAIDGKGKWQYFKERKTQKIDQIREKEKNIEFSREGGFWTWSDDGSFSTSLRFHSRTGAGTYQDNKGYPRRF